MKQVVLQTRKRMEIVTLDDINLSSLVVGRHEEETYFLIQNPDEDYLWIVLENAGFISDQFFHQPAGFKDSIREFLEAGGEVFTHEDAGLISKFVDSQIQASE